MKAGKRKIMLAFYDLDGEEFDNAGSFIRYYNKFYYNDYPGKIKCVSQSSRYIEKTIDDLLKNGITRELDVVRILAWKIEKINHNKSQETTEFVYTSDWKDAKKLEKTLNYKMESLNLKRYNNRLEINELTKYVCEVCKSFNDWTDKEKTQDILNEMKDKANYGIGSVYLITLLYFMSKGEYPIYDQYADRAVKAISMGAKLGNNISPDELPNKGSNAFCSMIKDDDSIYNEFKHSIINIFGDYERYKASRDIDRALWVYGHLFKRSKKENCDKEGKF